MSILFLIVLKFLEEVIGYKHMFLNKYPKLSIVDDEDISELDREIAKKFVEGSNAWAKKEEIRGVGEVSKQIPNCNFYSNNIVKESSNTKINIEKIDFITEQNSVKVNIKQKSSHPLKKFILNKIPSNSKNDYIYLQQIDQLKKELNELRLQNEKLMQINNNNEIEMNCLKIEMENVNHINKEYEKQIEEYKNKSTEKVEKENMTRLKQEMESWKREYFYISNKNMNMNLNTSASLNASKIFLDQIYSKRPQSALYLNNTNRLTDEKIMETKSIFHKFKNDLDDSLNNSLEDLYNISNNIQENRKNKNEVNHDDEDDELEELLRKSTSNLKSLKEEIKDLNKEAELKTHPTTINKEIYNGSNVKKLNPIKTGKTSQSKPKFITENIEDKIKLPNMMKNKK